MSLESNTNFTRRNPLSALRFEPMTFWLMSSCQGITFLTGICMSRVDYWWLVATHLLWTLLRSLNPQIWQLSCSIRVFHDQYSRCAMASLPTPSYQNDLKVNVYLMPTFWDQFNLGPFYWPLKAFYDPKKFVALFSWVESNLQLFSNLRSWIWT